MSRDAFFHQRQHLRWKTVMQKAFGIFQVAPGLPEEFVMGVLHITDRFFIIHDLILAILPGTVKG